ncbi:MAG TPA: hypothetical protein VID30_12080 [Bradyrhizobium sp.]|jgi:hypothetical protein
MNAHIKPAQTAQPDTEFVLAALRCTSQRLKLIDHQVIQIGVALKRGLISAQRAIDWCEEVAPGCLDVVSQSMETTP